MNKKSYQWVRCSVTFFVMWLSMAPIIGAQDHIQNYNVQVYQTRQGLPTNLTKGIIQDSQGFVWIASDLGIIRFDGKEFRHFTSNLVDNYPKQFLKTSDGTLLIAHDGGISSIEHDEITGEVRFLEFLPGGSEVGAQNVMYPKSMFEDSKGNLWIGEVFSIAKFNGSVIQRYTFSEKYRTGSFIRSFSVIEDGFGNIFASSQQGYLFWLNPKTDEFEEIVNTTGIALGTVNTLMYERLSDRIWIGATPGIFAIEISEDKETPSFHVAHLFTMEGVSTLVQSIAGEVFAGGWNVDETGLTRIFRVNDEWNASKIENFTLTSVNSLFADESNMIWAATDNGISLMYKTPFYRLPLKQERTFVQSISKHPSDERFFITDARFVYEIQFATSSNSFASSRIYENEINDDLLTVSASGENVWAGSSLGHLYKLTRKNNRKYTRTLVHSAENENSIFFTMADKNKNVWFVQYNEIGVSRVGSDGGIQNYRTSKGIDQWVSVIREGSGGDIVAGSGGIHKLYAYSLSQNRFDALPIVAPSSSDFSIDDLRVNDLAVDSSGNVYVASNNGIYYFDRIESTIEPIPLGEVVKNKYIKAIAVTKEGNIWFGTENGVFLRDVKNNITLEFDEEKGGVPSRTIANRGVVHTASNQLWVATPAGVGIFSESEIVRTTKTPILLESKINDKAIGREFPITFSSTSVLYLKFVSLSHPGSGITYQYKIGDNTEWTNIERRNELNIAGLAVGRYEIKVRSLQTSGNVWSEALNIPLMVLPPWYFRGWAIAFYVLSVILLLVITTRVYTRRLRQTKIELENLVEQRVAELKLKNEELELARNLLSESEQRYRSFYELSPVGITMHRMDNGVFTNCNDQFLKIVGYSLSEICQKTVSQITPKKFHASGDEQFEILKKNKKFGPYEKEIIHKNGLTVPVLVNGIQIADGEGDLLVYSVVQDITERKKFEQELIKLNEDKDRLVATIAHDIRNPIGAIFSFSDILLEEDDCDEERKKLLTTIHKNAESALTIASNLLELATLDAHTGEVTREWLDISELAADINEKFSDRLHSKSLSLEWHIKNDASCFANIELFPRVLDNLISNAIKFTPNGKKINVSISDDISTTLISIKDEGIGIPPEMKSKIFDRFTIAKRNGLNGERSTGLGMSIVKEIVSRHSGQITFESTVDIGTQFDIILPKDL